MIAGENRYTQGKCPSCGFLLRWGTWHCPVCSQKKRKSTSVSQQRSRNNNRDTRRDREQLLKNWTEGLRHIDPEVRKETVAALEKSRNIQAVEPLIKMLEQDENTFVRGQVAETLQQIGDSRIFEPFIKALNHDDHWYVRLIAVDVLGTLGGMKAHEALMKALDDKDSAVRAKAAEVLGNINQSEGVLSLLIDALRDEDLIVKEEAIETLKKIHNPSAIAPLTNLLHNDTHHTLRRLAAEALAAIGNEQAINVLVEDLENTDDQIRKDVKRALENLDRSAAKHLVKLLGTVNATVRSQLVHFLQLSQQRGWKPENDLERTVYAISKTQGNIKTVIFGNAQFDMNYSPDVLVNPDVSELTLPIITLKNIIVHATTYQFLQLEQFLTYALDYIGQDYLKENVDVFIYGDPKKLHPNFRNNFTNLCKCVHVQENETRDIS